jgi:uncharacterized membrane protein YgcG
MKSMNRKNIKVAIVMAVACSIIVPACVMTASTFSPSDPARQSIILPSIQPRAIGYDFSVTNETVHVFLNYDGSVTIRYWITFKNLYFGDVLDVADIGFPTGNYQFNTINASITSGGGTVIHAITSTDITTSPYVQYGVAIGFGDYSIPYNTQETLFVECNNPRVLYTDTVNSSKASFVFSPTWFDPEYGGYSISNYNLTIYFPANELDGSQLVYHEASDPWKVPTSGLQNFTGPRQNLYYNWYYSSISQEQHNFGVSFPKGWVVAGIIQTDPMLVIGMWILLAVGAGVVVLVSVIYIVAQQKKKQRTQYYPPVQKAANPFGGLCCCGIVITGVVVFVFVEDYAMLLFGATIAMLILAFIFMAYFIAKAIDKRRLKYEKPKLSIECVGVNKNMTVPEAAILKNTPLGTVIFLIVFGMMRKGIIDIVKTSPLLLEQKQKIFPENLRKVAEEGRKIRDYELDFYDSIGANGTIVEAKLKESLIRMIKKTHAKMVGFDLKATILYHDSLMEKAWNQVKNTSGDIKFDEIADQFGYLVLDQDFAKKAPTYFGNRMVYMPYWYARPYSYWHVTPGISSGIAAPFARTGGLGAINAVDFANSVATGLTNISSNIATNVSSFFNSIVSAVSPPPPSSSGGGGSGSGGGRSYSGGSCACACACACAGCACACAGGGR